MGFFMFLFCGLGVGFGEPKPFINAARNLREQFRSVSIIQFVRLVDCAAGGLSKSRKRAGYGFDMSHTLCNGEWILGES